MGFLDEYDVNLDEFNESGFDVPDGQYVFEVSKGELRKGTNADPDVVHVVISFALENEDGEVKTWNWWLKVPDDPSRPTRRESISMSDWKKWCLAAGFETPNEVGPEDVEGITGTVRLVSTPGKGKNADRMYTNPRDWTFDTEEEPAPKPTKATKPTKKRPEPEPDEEDDEDTESPFDTTPARAPRTAKKGNPFAKK